MSHVPYPSTIRFGCKAWEADREAPRPPHAATCPTCGGAKDRGIYCAGCTGYAPFDHALGSEAVSAESRRLRRLRIARDYLNDGHPVAEVAAVLGLSEGEVSDVNKELEAALECREPGKYAFTPKGARRMNRRERHALKARAAS